MTRFQRKLWLGLLIMALLTPVGLLLPEVFGAGDAWGEWGTDTLLKLLGYIPEGLKKTADFWKAPIADYNLGGENTSMTLQIISYIMSGILGILLVTLAVYLVSRTLMKNGK